MDLKDVDPVNLPALENGGFDAWPGFDLSLTSHSKPQIDKLDKQEIGRLYCTCQKKLLEHLVRTRFTGPSG